MIKVMLKGYKKPIDLIALIDDEDEPILLNNKWHKQYTKAGYYAAATIKINGKFQTVLMHRYIMERIIGRSLAKVEHVDHINGDRLDNRRSNLRLCTRAQNYWNKKASIANKSGYKGVCYDKRSHKWLAYITANKKRTYLGYYLTIEEAINARWEAAQEIHGEFAKAA